MQYIDVDFTTSAENSAERVGLLRGAGVRVEQRLVVEPDRRPVHITAVHPDDLQRAEDMLAAAARVERERYVRGLRLVRVPYAEVEMLVTREPCEAGLYASFPYDGRPFDHARLRHVPGGWDHEHCELCAAKVLPGDEWWAAEGDGRSDPVGVCLACHRDVVAGPDAEPHAAAVRQLLGDS
jgi:hypothetical protein